MHASPKVSVVMPVFNAKPYLGEAIDSILTQTFADFEFIIVDDGSRDGSREVLFEYARRDSRITVLLNENNLAIPQTMNRAVAAARGEYIARMDADDIALPQRLGRQVEFMDTHPDVGACGASFATFGDFSSTHRHPLDDAQIKVDHLIRGCAISNPSGFFRRRLIEDSDLRCHDEDAAAEDYWFWIRLGFVTKLANLPDVLVRYRIHAKQISQVQRRLQDYNVARAQVFFATQLFRRDLTEAEKKSHLILSGQRRLERPAELHDIAEYAEMLLRANACTAVVEQACLRKALQEQSLEVARQYAGTYYKYAGRYDPALLRQFMTDRARPHRSLSFKDTLKFALKCMLHYAPSHDGCSRSKQI